MLRFVLMASVTLSLGMAATAMAQGSGMHYRWVDGSGLSHYSDSLTNDAVKFGYDVINSDGMVVAHIGKQLSPSERAAAEQQAATQAAQQRKVEQQKRDDMQMLNTYPDEDALKAEQQQVLQDLDEQISTTRANLHSQDAALTDLLNRAADDERAKQPVPKALVDQITAQRNVVANQRALLQHQQAHREDLVQQQAQALQHYRDLKAGEKADRGY
ncbi:DUF4124 domain-containing protein [Dyella mobilis]|uniref:DUF4124 domain-containing protein n=1 Tax=Dyella mobilis TaxID=1849582 RepID=A0ABS2KFR6_9GAMM|nr:DUF4124 domain-containing protein [Dyella mobilis]MBM7130007.1 DUF4124 domain-containing protein [Dyella mobilis]GLQ97728.1 hypothetical protein GCM10007863_21480 [Dyella mobilis]